VELEAHRGQRATDPAPLGQQHDASDQEQTDQQAVADDPVDREVRVIAPEESNPIEIRYDARQHDEPAILARARAQVGNDPAHADMRKEMQRRQHDRPRVDGSRKHESSPPAPMPSAGAAAAR